MLTTLPRTVPASDPYALDVHIVPGPVAGTPGRACDTSDNCPPTCASSCASASS
ncbi:FxLD family lanthipeptide [Bailinhaonella thermotolerans]|uniref:FxLD family lanthipeptide n=1 Tax=Bailinhaonella thermotolerans TaxID=1070861 RepID=UPI00192A31BC|nr:FxLD family lanthipeptide [Bailinhaonella thermotolerans]